MYTSTPADVPDPPFRFFEGLAPRLGTRLAGMRSLHVVVAKAYTVGKALHLAVLLIAMPKNSLLAALVTLGWP